MSEEQKHRRDLSRRRVLVLRGGAVVAAGIGAEVVGTASAGSGTDGAVAEGCYRLTSETTEGPYYIDADKIRKDITEGKAGIPRTLRLKVIDAESCKPLKGVAVDI
nr:hypothetical protein [Streptomyces sp. NRRL F-5727]